MSFGVPVETEEKRRRQEEYLEGLHREITLAMIIVSMAVADIYQDRHLTQRKHARIIYVYYLLTMLVYIYIIKQEALKAYTGSPF